MKAASGEILRAEGLVRRFGGLVAVDGASLSVDANGLHALIGPNGAGKTTLVQLLCGALAPAAGRVYFQGRDVTSLPVHARARLGLVRSFQITSIFRRLTVLDNLALAVQADAGSRRGFLRPARAEHRRFDIAATIAHDVGLADRLHAMAGMLSHGEQRQLELGLVLAARPALLLLDEPLAGMGTEESGRMLTLLQGLRNRHAILLIEHDMEAVFRLADCISVLESGRIIATGSPAEIQAHPEVRRAYLGDDHEADTAARSKGAA